MAFVGIICKITSTDTDKVYVGSTVKTLKARLHGHISDYKKYISGEYYYVTSFEIVKYVDVSIELLHEGEFACKKDMHILEGQSIQLTDNSVNRNIAGRSKTEYYQHNQAKILENKKGNFFRIVFYALQDDYI